MTFHVKRGYAERADHETVVFHVKRRGPVDHMFHVKLAECVVLREFAAEVPRTTARGSVFGYPVFLTTSSRLKLPFPATPSRCYNPAGAVSGNSFLARRPDRGTYLVLG